MRLCLRFLPYLAKKSPCQKWRLFNARYLLELKAGKNSSESYFKHTVYGLRFLFRLFGCEDRAIQLSPIRRTSQLPVVWSKAECRKFFATPKLLKHRIIIGQHWGQIQAGRPVFVQHCANSPLPQGQPAFSAYLLCGRFLFKYVFYFINKF